MGQRVERKGERKAGNVNGYKVHTQGNCVQNDGENARIESGREWRKKKAQGKRGKLKKEEAKKLG